MNDDHTALRRAGCASVAWKDRYILIFGGREKDRFYNDCWEYDTLNKTITSLTGMNAQSLVHVHVPEPRPRAHHTATLVGDVVYLVGGSGKGGIVDDVWCFHIKTSSWDKAQLS